MKRFYLPPGYRIELVASEPLVQDPIAADWDADGRLWVVEYPEFVRNLADRAGTSRHAHRRGPGASRRAALSSPR
jgi:hypothetical protein